MQDEAVISIEHISKRYKHALQPTVTDLSLNVYRGEIFGLLGPNGAGKTTTISMICGMIRPDTGTIRINGLSVETEFEAIKHQLGVVPQEIALFDNLSALENLRYFGQMYSIPSAKLNDKIAYYLDRFGLTGHEKKWVHHYSGGMKRRVNLIAALLHEPQLLILDEPTVGVDVQSRHVILNFLKEINRERGVSILYTSHLLEEAEDLCSRVAIIDSGHILSKGTPNELIAATEGADNLQSYFIQLTGETLRD